MAGQTCSSESCASAAHSPRSSASSSTLCCLSCCLVLSASWSLSATLAHPSHAPLPGSFVSDALTDELLVAGRWNVTWKALTEVLPLTIGPTAVLISVGINVALGGKLELVKLLTVRRRRHSGV